MKQENLVQCTQTIFWYNTHKHSPWRTEKENAKQQQEWENKKTNEKWKKHWIRPIALESYRNKSGKSIYSVHIMLFICSGIFSELFGHREICSVVWLNFFPFRYCLLCASFLLLFFLSLLLLFYYYCFIYLRIYPSASRDFIFIM